MSNSAKFFKEERLDGTLPCLPFHLIEPSVDDLQEAAVARHDYSAMDDFEEKRRRKEPCIHSQIPVKDPLAARAHLLALTMLHECSIQAPMTHHGRRDKVGTSSNSLQ